jgi:hypothetical protein
MITDRVPKKATSKTEYQRSDDMRIIELPPLTPLRAHVAHLKESLAADDRKEVQVACNAIASAVAKSYKVPVPPVRVLSVRPLKVTENSTYETFGDYDPNDHKIRLWMRTAVLKKPTSFGTLLSTLCHEICHHLDVVSLEMPNTYHTRGFYERAGLLYHHIQGTPVRRLVWVEQKGGTFRIDWAKTMRR